MQNDTPLQTETHIKSKHKTRRSLWAIIGVIVVLPLVAGIVSVKVFQFRTMSDAAARQVVPPLPVNAVQVREDNWQPVFSAVGTVRPVQGTTVRAEAEGTVRRIAFKAGSSVKAGEVLIKLDIDIEQSRLQAAEADLQWARAAFKRAKGLVAPQAISKADFDSAENALKQALARVDNLRAVIAKKTVRAPFDGVLGIQQISVGQFLTKGSPVVSLHALAPLYVDYSLPQQKLGDLKQGLAVTVVADAFPDQPFTGTVTSINPEIDAATRNVRIQATLNDTDGRLRPGMFVTVDTFVDRSRKVLLIPSTAVLHAPFGSSVFIIEAGEGPESDPDTAPATDGAKPLVVRQQFVRLGEQRGDYVAAIEGVEPGETIVATGTFKLRNGMAVMIDNTLAPEFRLAPTPDNT